jgi:capsular polysaccharide biosynthesis protein
VGHTYGFVSVSVLDVYRALWRHRYFTIFFTLALVLGVWYLTKREQKTYTATTLVRVEQHVANATEALNALETGTRLAQTYAKIATTDAIASRISVALHGQVPQSEPFGALTASEVQDLELLTISAKSHSPRDAQLMANAAPQALRDFISQTGTSHDQVITIQRAGLPGAPSSPNVTLNVIAALALGIVFSGAIALLAELLLDRPSSLEELEAVAGVPVLAAVPRLRFARLVRPGRTGTRTEQPNVVTPAQSERRQT